MNTASTLILIMQALVTAFVKWAIGIFCNSVRVEDENLLLERDLDTMAEECWWTAKIWAPGRLDFLDLPSRSSGTVWVTEDTTTTTREAPRSPSWKNILLQ